MPNAPGLKTAANEILFTFRRTYAVSSILRRQIEGGEKPDNNERTQIEDFVGRFATANTTKIQQRIKTFEFGLERKHAGKKILDIMISKEHDLVTKEAILDLYFNHEFSNVVTLVGNHTVWAAKKDFASGVIHWIASGKSSEVNSAEGKLKYIEPDRQRHTGIMVLGPPGVPRDQLDRTSQFRVCPIVPGGGIPSIDLLLKAD